VYCHCCVVGAQLHKVLVYLMVFFSKVHPLMLTNSNQGVKDVVLTNSVLVLYCSCAVRLCRQQR
jgi:hypothetical protein